MNSSKLCVVGLALSVFVVIALLGGGGYGYHVMDEEIASLEERLQAQQKAHVAEINEREKKIQALSETADRLQKRLQEMTDASARDRLQPTLEAIQAGEGIVKAFDDIGKASTSLQRDQKQAAFDQLVETTRGRHVIFRGVVKDVGKRIVSFSEMYLSLQVQEGFTVKFIFGKESKDVLLKTSTGDELVLSGYLASKGDLMHNLTVGGSVGLPANVYQEAVRLLGKQR